jgi:hypothetical protein
MNFACPVARVDEYGRASALRPDHTQRPEAGATLHETRKRTTRRLLEAVLKGLGIALLLVACAMLVYLGAVLLARGADWILVP